MYKNRWCSYLPCSVYSLSFGPQPVYTCPNRSIPVRVHTTLFARIWIIRNIVFILLLQCSFKFYYRKRSKERLRRSWPNISRNLDIVFPTPVLLQPLTFSLVIRVSNSSRDIPFFAYDFNIMRSPVSLGGNSIPHSMELHCWVFW